MKKQLLTILALLSVMGNVQAGNMAKKGAVIEFELPCLPQETQWLVDSVLAEGGSIVHSVVAYMGTSMGPFTKFALKQGLKMAKKQGVKSANMGLKAMLVALKVTNDPKLAEKMLELTKKG